MKKESHDKKLKEYNGTESKNEECQKSDEIKIPFEVNKKAWDLILVDDFLYEKDLDCECRGFCVYSQATIVMSLKHKNLLGTLIH